MANLHGLQRRGVARPPGTFDVQSPAHRCSAIRPLPRQQCLAREAPPCSERRRRQIPRRRSALRQSRKSLRRSATITVAEPAAGRRPSAHPVPVPVTMQRAAVGPTDSQALWTLIRQSTNALSFESYQAFMEHVLCRTGSAAVPSIRQRLKRRQQMGQNLPWRLPFPGVDPYRQLKAATEIFVMLNCGVPLDKFMTGTASPFLSPTQQWSADGAKTPGGWTSRPSFGTRAGDTTRPCQRPSDIRAAWNRRWPQGRRPRRTCRRWSRPSCTWRWSGPIFPTCR